MKLFGSESVDENDSDAGSTEMVSGEEVEVDVGLGVGEEVGVDVGFTVGVEEGPGEVLGLGRSWEGGKAAVLAAPPP